MDQPPKLTPGKESTASSVQSRGRSQPISIFARKRDLAYLVFFCIHIPVLLLVDTNPLYPLAIKPQFLTTIRDWYIAGYGDRFFTHPPAWFDAYIWMEALYHLPLSVWAIGALRRDDPLIPLHLLVYALQSGLTTFTCIADFSSWDISSAAKRELAKLYVPYLAVSIFMGIDMFDRLSDRLKR